MARPLSSPVSRQASSAPGSISGVIQDERGIPIPNAVVSVLGAVTTIAVTDAAGRYEVGMLAAGPYMVRAHHAGFAAPRAQMVQVRASARSVSSISLRRDGAPPVLAAGLGLTGLGGASATEPPVADVPAATASGGTRRGDDHGETAWRIRHGRRGVLKDATLPDDLLADADEPDGGVFPPIAWALGTSARVASSLIADADWTGQVNLLASGTFDSPQQLFSADGFSRNVANFRVGTPAGPGADWSVSGALTEADVSSWVVSGAYSMRAPARHRYDVGLSYSTQRYGGGNPLAVRDVTDGSRNVGTVYAYDSFTLSPAATVSFGTEFARYDYLASRGLLSPRVELTLTPTSNVRLMASVSQRALAPGAEEFLPPAAAGIWLPPQRTFSSLDRNGAFRAQRTTSAAVGLERDFGATTVAVRAFRQRVADPLLTVFGADLPGRASATVGHYLVGNTTDLDVQGYSAEFRALIASRVHGAVEYSLARGRILQSGNDYLMLLSPVAQGGQPGTIHDVTARVDAQVPETATRVMIVYRLSNAFLQPAGRQGRAGRPVDGRFDVQVRQSLPFMNFSSARWEMLLAVRNFFREVAGGQALYDELLVVGPPKRVLGGVTLHF